MERPLLPIALRDLDVGTSAWLVLAALACALLCPPLVLAFLVTLIFAAETAAGLCLATPAATIASQHRTRRVTLRGPPTR